MGTFIDMLGQATIQKDKLPELTRRVLEIFTRGGMMELEELRLFGMRTLLLTPPELKNGELNVSYNYFEDDSWENAGYVAESGELWSQKVGGGPFNWVLAAAYLQSELMSETPCFYQTSGSRMYLEDTTGWLNHLFGEQYDLEQRGKVWPMFEVMHDHRFRACGDHEVSLRELEVMLPEQGINENAYCAAVAVIRGCDCFREGIRGCEGESKGLDPVTAGIHVKDIIRELWTESGMRREEVTEQVLGFLCDRNHPWWAGGEALPDHVLRFVIQSLLTTPQVVVKALSEVAEQEFWTLWGHVRGKVCYTQFNGRITCKPVQPVTTSRFLNVRPEDMLYFWREDGDVPISPETEVWFAELRERLQKYMAGEVPPMDGLTMMKRMMEDLNEADRRFGRVYAFRSMFYEFAEHAGEREYQAWWNIFRDLMQENKAAVVDLSGHSWCLLPREQVENPPRMLLRRYLALMANPVLRGRTFGKEGPILY